MKVVEDSTQGKGKGEIEPGVIEVCYPCREGVSAEFLGYKEPRWMPADAVSDL